jgi:hypothetical protein
MRTPRSSAIVAAALLLAAGAAAGADRAAGDRPAGDRAEDRATMDRTDIIGNRELPKVLYIVPWKKPVAGDLTGPPTESVLDEALAPVDRDVFRRQVRYHNLANPGVSEQRSDPLQATSPAVAPDRK